MPLTMARSGVPNIIHEIHGKDETKHFLEKLGFVVGGSVTIIAEIEGNMIVNVKEARIAISKGMASKIMVA